MKCCGQALQALVPYVSKKAPLSCPSKFGLVVAIQGIQVPKLLAVIGGLVKLRFDEIRFYAGV